MNQKVKHLGTGEISTLIWKQSLPSIVGLLVISLYNVVDTIFIGQSVGSIGIAGLMIVMPIQMLFMGFTQMIGMGSASIISRALGAKNHKKASQTLGNFFSFNLIVAFIGTSLGLIFLTPLLYLFGATESIFPYAYDYAHIILLGAVFLTISASSGAVIRSEGDARYAMLIMLGSALTNLILDPIFIFGFDWGVSGAALATIIGQAVGAFFALCFFCKKKSAITISSVDLIPRWGIVKEISFVGSSSLARQSAASITAIVVNNSLVFYGGEIAELAVAAYGILSKVLMLSFMPIFGFVQGLQPIFGYNYGAKKYNRAIESITDSIKKVTSYCLVMFVLLFIFTDSFVQVFTDDQELINLTVYAIRIVFLAIPLIGFQEIAGGIYQSMGNARKAFFVSLLRQFVVLLPLMLIMPFIFGLNGIFMAYPIADSTAALINYFLLRYEYKKLHEHKIKIHASEILPE